MSLKIKNQISLILEIAACLLLFLPNMFSYKAGDGLGYIYSGSFNYEYGDLSFYGAIGFIKRVHDVGYHGDFVDLTALAWIIILTNVFLVGLCFWQFKKNMNLWYISLISGVEAALFISYINGLSKDSSLYVDGTGDGAYIYLEMLVIIEIIMFVSATLFSLIGYILVKKTVIKHISKTENVQDISFCQTEDLIRYKNLLDNGIITEEEFETKKKELLKL